MNTNTPMPPNVRKTFAGSVIFFRRPDSIPEAEWLKLCDDYERRNRQALDDAHAARGAAMSGAQVIRQIETPTALSAPQIEQSLPTLPAAGSVDPAPISERSTSRRSIMKIFALAAASSPLAAVFPAAAAGSPPGPAPTLEITPASLLAPGHMLFRVANRTIEVDTQEMPRLRSEFEPSSLPGRPPLEVLYSEPELGAEYLVISLDCALSVTALVKGDFLHPTGFQRQRLGYVAGMLGGMRTKTPVSVLGKVVGSEAARAKPPKDETPVDPMLEAVAFRNMAVAAANACIGDVGDREADLLSESDRRLLACTPTTRAGALAALGVIRCEIAEYSASPLSLHLLDAAMAVLR